MSEEIIDTYSTEVKPQQDLDISYEGSGFEDVINENGVIPTTLNEKVIIQRIAKDLYKNATSGIRELYMNAVRGCVEGVEMFGYSEPHITVTINEGERIVIIEDNGRGISKARFKQVLRELGTSDNFDGKTTGQFGMGFASYMTLASVVVLDTISDNGDNYKMICRDGTSSKYGGKSDLDEHGVKLTLTCYEKVNFDEICDKLYETARHATVPTTVIIEEFEYGPDNFREGSNVIEQVGFDEGLDDIIGEGVIKIEHEDFTLIASDSEMYSKSNVYLLNVPIDSEIEVPFSWWVLNIKDERKYQPMPDRDRMREESDKALQSQITSFIHEYFKDIKIENYNDYINSDRRREFIWLIGHQEYAVESLQPLLQLLGRCGSLRKIDYEDKSPSAHSLIYWLRVAGDSGITYQGYKNKEYTDKVKTFIDAKCVLLIAKRGKNETWRSSVETLERFGVPTVKQILKDNKVKMPKRVKRGSDKMIVAHSHTQYYDTQDTYVEEVGEDAVRVDSMKMSKLISFVREFPTDMIFMRNDPALKTTDCQVFSQWIEKFKSVEVMTNKGPMTADVLAQEKGVMYCHDLEPELVSLVEGLDKTVITDKNKTLGVALLKYLFYNTTKTGWLSDLLERCYLDTLFKEKYGINMYSDEAKKFFCAHLSEIKPCYQELFARVVTSVKDNFADSVAENEWGRYLALIREYSDLPDDDEIGKLKFYHSKWINLPNKEAGITQIFDTLMGKSKKNILDNNYLLAKFIQEVALPKVFGEVVVRKLTHNEGENYYSNNNFKVSFTTKHRSLDFKEELKVMGLEIQFKDINVRIFKNHSLITVTLVASS